MQNSKFYSSVINSPTAFKKNSFRTLSTKQKGLTFIAGTLKATSKLAVQSFQYTKTVWSSEKARQHSTTKGGRFETATTRKQLCLADEHKDYLLVDEITTEIVSGINLSFLYRTHKNLHEQVKSTQITDELTAAHVIVADELVSRGILHHSWDELDSIYQN